MMMEFRRPDKSFVEEIFNFDARKLEQTASVIISKYCISLAQFIIYMRSEINADKVEITKIKRFIDSVINLSLNKNLIKEYGTKALAIESIVKYSEDLQKKRDAIGIIEEKLMLIEGQDKNISELIAVFKRELTRRENELYHTRMERKN